MKSINKPLKRFFSRPEYVFIVPALIFGLLSAVFMPQLIVNDENMHFIRSYELSELEFGHECTIPADIKDRGFFAMYATDKPDYSFSNKRVDTSQQVQTDCGTATSYNPVLHLPQTLGVVLGKLIWPTAGAMILFGRIFNVLLYAAAMFFIIRKAKVGKWVIAVIGLLPMMIHMAGSLSGDVVNNIILLGFITYVFNLYVQKTSMRRGQVVTLLVLSGLLAVTKLPNVALLLMVLFLPKAVLPNISLKKWLVPDFMMRVALALFCGLSSILVVFLWAHFYDGSVVASSNIDNPLVKEPHKFMAILFNTYLNPNIAFGGISYGEWLFRGVFGSFASFGYYLPYTVVSVIVTLFVVIGLRHDPAEERLLKNNTVLLSIVTTVSLAIVIAAITYGLYTAWAIQPERLGEGASYALGLQGRYFTPLLLMLVPTFILARRYVSVRFKEGVVGVVVFAVSSVALLVYIAQTMSYAAALGI